MNGRAECIEATDKVISAVLAYLLTERGLHADEKAAARLPRDWDALKFAARDLARTVTEMPVQDWPKGWDE